VRRLKALPRPVAVEDVFRAVEACRDEDTQLMLLFGALAGLRRFEIAKLTAEDVHLTAAPPVVFIEGKGRKERIVPLHPELVARLRRRRF
jgi:integrase